MDILTMITTVAVAIIGSGIIQWAFNRRDTRSDKLTELEKKIDAVAVSVNVAHEREDQREAESIRRHILDFSDQCRMGRDRSFESFVVALDDCKKYEDYCRTHQKFVNGKTEMSIAQIREMFKKKFPMEVKS